MSKKKLQQISLFDEPKVVPKKPVPVVTDTAKVIEALPEVQQIESNLQQQALFDVSAVRTVAKEVKSTKKIGIQIMDVSCMGLVAISENKCTTFKTIADSFGNKLR